MTIRREEDRLNIKPFDPRPEPGPIPSSSPFTTPTRQLLINGEWASHVIGVLERLDQPDAWIGTAEEIEQAMQYIEEIIVQLSTDI